jgi:hypothetical protein
MLVSMVTLNEICFNVPPLSKINFYKLDWNNYAHLKSVKGILNNYANQHRGYYANESKAWAISLDVPKDRRNKAGI